MSVLLVTGHPDAARVLRCSDVRFGSMLSKKSKIEELRKSRKDQVLVVSVTASLCRACTKICDRFAAIRCGPSRWPSMGPTSGAEKFCSSARKDFFDSIGHTQKSASCAARPLYCPRADVGRPLPEIDHVSASVSVGASQRASSKQEILAGG